MSQPARDQGGPILDYYGPAEKSDLEPWWASSDDEPWWGSAFAGILISVFVLGGVIVLVFQLLERLLAPGTP
jgi:hypothetical protein